tara:strand:- start:2596 stop:3309 length:714 start_codon:yes stop_codon:yes gene_type:complete
MRYYHTLEEAKNEISRDLKELAVVYQSNSVQDKDVSKDPDYLTHELINYSYSISSKTIMNDTWQWGLKNLDGDYLKEELHERLTTGANPGNAYKNDEEYWSQFLHDSGEFAYSYPERLEGNVEAITRHLIKNPESRQLWVPIWWNHEDHVNRDEGHRVPCSLGYHFMMRNYKLHMHYVMRSCDFYKHWAKDVILAIAYGDAIIQALKNSVKEPVELGSFSHTIFSLHGFAKDMKGIF